MLVSGISLYNDNGYRAGGNISFYDNRSNEIIGDTAFNSLPPNKKNVSSEKMSQIYDNINEWQTFCHNQILGQKLNTIV